MHEKYESNVIDSYSSRRIDDDEVHLKTPGWSAGAGTELSAFGEICGHAHGGAD